MSDENIDDLLNEFNQDELYLSLFEKALHDLKEKHEQIKYKEDGSPEFEKFVQSYVGALFGDAVPATTAKNISAAGTLLMFATYGSMREEGKNHCESLIAAQNNFVEMAYYIASDQDVGASDAHEIIKSAISTLKSSFGNYQAYIGGDPNQYAEFLSKVTHDALDQIHGNCKGLDENLSILNKKYSL